MPIFVHHIERFAAILADAARRERLSFNRLSDWPAIEAAAKADARMSDPANGVMLCKRCHDLFPHGGIDFDPLDRDER